MEVARWYVIWGTTSFKIYKVVHTSCMESGRPIKIWFNESISQAYIYMTLRWSEDEVVAHQSAPIHKQLN